MRDFVRKPGNLIGLFIVVVLLLSLLVNFFSSFNTNLPSYVGDDFQQTDVEETTTPDIETVTYNSDELNFSMLVPADWTNVIKSGNESFINPQDGSMISFAINSYNPSLNNITEEYINNDIVAADGLLGGFVKDTNSSYFVIYEIGELDYFEYTSWDLDNMIRVSIQIPAAKYSSYEDIIIYLIDSFTWNKENPLPDNCMMYYSDYASFEFPIPDGWSYQIENGVFKAENSLSGAFYTVSVSDLSYDLSSVSQIDYFNSISSGKSSYLLNNFNNGGSFITSEATFTENGVQQKEYRSMLAANNYLYEVVFQCPLADVDSCMKDYLVLQQYFRVFS
jgi:hypothetical protein